MSVSMSILIYAMGGVALLFVLLNRGLVFEERKALAACTAIGVLATKLANTIELLPILMIFTHAVVFIMATAISVVLFSTSDKESRLIYKSQRFGAVACGLLVAGSLLMATVSSVAQPGSVADLMSMLSTATGNFAKAVAFAYFAITLAAGVVFYGDKRFEKGIEAGRREALLETEYANCGTEPRPSQT